MVKHVILWTLKNEYSKEEKEAIKGYSVHPAHVAVANGKVRPHTAIRSCLDYTID